MACCICGEFFGFFKTLESGLEICNICSKNMEHIEIENKNKLKPSNSILNTVNIEQQPQRQDSTTDQLRDLCIVANRLGMYDASDYIRNIIEKRKDDDSDGVGIFWNRS